jgi:hypothetical protein
LVEEVLVDVGGAQKAASKEVDCGPRDGVVVRDFVVGVYQAVD